MFPGCRFKFRAIASLSIAIIAGSTALTAADSTQKAAAAFYEGIRAETLKNGLRVYLKPIPGSPVVTTMVAYKVGSADENLDATGLSHYLEHLMFKGTEKLMPGDIDRMTMRSGGQNNAYTTEDLTNYHFDFAADRWETALEIEADRMRNLRIDTRHEFEQEKGAVISELQMGEDRPFDLEYKAILPVLFGKTAPYGHPVIGEREHVRGTTAQVIKAHYDSWYYPNNAVLVVVGGFDPDQAMAKIRQLFSSIPAGKLPERKPMTPTSRDNPVHIQIPSKFEVPRMLMGFNGVKIGDADYYPLEIIQMILSGGKTSRLYRKLVEGESIASDVSAGNNAGRYPGWFEVRMELLDGKSKEKAEQLVIAELQRLASEPISPEELKRVRRLLASGYVFGRESVHSLADSIARGVVDNDLEFLKSYLPKTLAVTPEQIQAAAKKYLDPQKRVVVWSVPKEKSAGGASGHAKPAKRQAEPAKPIGGATFSLDKTKRVVLQNGLTLLLLEDHRLPIVVANAYVLDTRLTEPADKAGVANLVGNLLDEGTAHRTGQQIAATIEDVGGILSMSAAGGSVQVLAPDRALGLELLFDCLMNPNFPADALERKRAQIVSELIDAEKRADVEGRRAFLEVIYGDKHPMSRPSAGNKSIVEKLTAEDCRQFHSKRFTPNNTLVAVVGDFDAAAVVNEITSLTKDWKPATTPKADLPEVPSLNHVVEKILSMPESAQLYMFLGHLGIRRVDPDYYKLLVMDYVLGTGTGFTDRLSASLRDRQGLAYSVHASITGSAGEIPGTFTGAIAPMADKFTAVKQGFMKEINRIRDETPSTQEVEDAKTYLLGSLPFHFASTRAIAGQLLQIERFQLGFDYLNKYRHAVAAVSPADVQAVARKHLHPAAMAIIGAGPVDSHGQPLQRPK